jgi:hypothetical protein
MTLQLAQVNVARMRGPLESEVMAGFVARLDEINALADRSPGFVWRLQTGEGNATYLRPYDDDRTATSGSASSRRRTWPYGGSPPVIGRRWTRRRSGSPVSTSTVRPPSRSPSG